MKFYPSQIDSLFNKISNRDIKALLFFGPDRGVIGNIIANLAKKQNLQIRLLEGNDVKAGELRLVLNTPNFFGQKELIKIDLSGSAIKADIKNILAEDNLHLPVFLGYELSTTSSAKIFFDQTENLASIGCYYSDEAGVAKICISKTASMQKLIYPDALSYIKDNLKGDYQYIENEISKLISYTHDKSNISLEDAKAVISSDFSGNGDLMCIHFCNKDREKFISELQKLQTQGINEVLMIRALIRFYLNLYIFLVRSDKGEGADFIIKTFAPPLFFKYHQDFKNIAKKIRIPETLEMLSKLQNAEVKFKLESDGFDLFNLSI